MEGTNSGGGREVVVLGSEVDLKVERSVSGKEEKWI